MATPVTEAAWLEWIGGLLDGTPRQSCAVAFPPDHFYCLLDELPLHLVPRGFVRRLHDRESSREPLRLNEEIYLCPAGQMPDEVKGAPELLDQFALQSFIAWIRDATTRCLLPFWLAPRTEAALRDLLAGEIEPGELAGADRLLFRAAGILRSHHQAGQQGSELRDGEEKSAVEFRENGYVPMAGLIHPFHIAALRLYYRYRIRRGLIHLGDQQSARRYVAHNEPVARFFHHQLAATVGALAGHPVKPSYVYLASYLSGAELKKHTDREQCEFSVTLCLDFSPEPERETPWPIHLDTPHGKSTVYQSIGDGLVYRGTRLPHYRDILPEGQTSTSIFFHYVASDFKGSLT